jgi:hypothetical protein
MSAISLDRLDARIRALARFGALPGGGVTRPAWSPQHEEARAWLVAEMRAAGLTPWVDAAGNVTDACYWAPGAAVGTCYEVGHTPWPSPPTRSTTSTGATVSSSPATTASRSSSPGSSPWTCCSRSS